MVAAAWVLVGLLAGVGACAFGAWIANRQADRADAARAAARVRIQEDQNRRRREAEAVFLEQDQRAAENIRRHIRGTP